MPNRFFKAGILLIALLAFVFLGIHVAKANTAPASNVPTVISGLITSIQNQINSLKLLLADLTGPAAAPGDTGSGSGSGGDTTPPPPPPSTNTSGGDTTPPPPTNTSGGDTSQSSSPSTSTNTSTTTTTQNPNLLIAYCTKEGKCMPNNHASLSVPSGSIGCDPTKNNADSTNVVCQSPIPAPSTSTTTNVNTSTSTTPTSGAGTTDNNSVTPPSPILAEFTISSVGNFQEAFDANGYGYLNPSGATGKYGAETTAMVVKFQQDNGFLLSPSSYLWGSPGRLTQEIMERKFTVNGLPVVFDPFGAFDIAYRDQMNTPGGGEKRPEEKKYACIGDPKLEALRCVETIAGTWSASRCLTDCSITVKNNFTCADNKLCIVVPNGEYTNAKSCFEKCPLPPPPPTGKKYRCVASDVSNAKCVEDVTGTFNNYDCAVDCKPTASFFTCVGPKDNPRCEGNLFGGTNLKDCLRNCIPPTPNPTPIPKPMPNPKPKNGWCNSLGQCVLQTGLDECTPGNNSECTQPKPAPTPNPEPVPVPTPNPVTYSRGICNKAGQCLINNVSCPPPPNSNPLCTCNADSGCKVSPPKPPAPVSCGSLIGNPPVCRITKKCIGNNQCDPKTCLCAPKPIKVGMIDKVSPLVSLNVRSAPSLTSNVLHQELVGIQGTVTAGPTDADGFTWWQVTWANGDKGWSAQASSDGTDYIEVVTP